MLNKVVGWVILLCLLTSINLAAAAADDRPHIIVIMSDDMGYSDIGCYGSEIATPTLDQLAANGLRFTQFYNTARCCPTRASLLTGLYPHQAGVGHMLQPTEHPGYTGGLNERCQTIAEVLRPAGYRTYMTGKWHVTQHRGPDGPKNNWPLQRGFEKFYGTITGAGSFYDPTSLCRGNTFVTPQNDPDYKPEAYYYTDAISDNAVSFLRQHQEESPEQPFFMYVAYTAAHWPMHALPEDIAKYRGTYDEGYAAIRKQRLARMQELGLVDPAWQLSPAAGQWRDVEHPEWEARCMEVYAAMVDRMDQGIGKIVRELENQKELDNTLVLFLQDNGGCAEGLGRRDVPRWHLSNPQPMRRDELQPNIWPPMRTRDGQAVLGGPQVMPGPANTYIAYGEHWANVSNTPFREYKHWVHEGGISTPLVAHWPRGISRRGKLEHQPGHLIDIMATCVDLAGAKYPQTVGDHTIHPLEGVSLRPAFGGQSLDRPGPLSWEHEGNRAIRVGDWKLVAKHNQEWELYNLATDRTEMHNLAAQQPERVQQLAAQWQAWAERAQVLPLTPYWKK